MNQRWKQKRASFRPHDPIDTARYEVAPIACDGPAKEFILTHHYAHSFPAARFRFGLYTDGRLAGVAVFSHPVNDRTLTGVFGGQAVESVELGRFVLLDEVPGNGESWFLGQVFRHLRREGLRGVLSFSDPQPRTTSSGFVVFPGHVGGIYQAHNARFLGRGTARNLRVLPDGTVLNDRTIQKIRQQEKGWEAASRKLAEYGAPAVGGDVRGWLKTWLPHLCRRLPHRGNFKYAWSLDRAVRLPDSLPYPKRKSKG